jgi:ankyrin repeat protein
MDYEELKHHLNLTKDKFNVVSIYDKSGYTPMHYAAYKNI